MISGFMSENPDQDQSTKKPVRSAQQLTPPPTEERGTDVYDLLAWFEVNKKPIALVLVVSAAIGFAIYTWSYLKEQKELKASTALFDLHPALAYPTNVAPPQASSLVKVAQEYSGTAAAERAELLAASALFTENKYSEAQAAFEKFMNQHPQSLWFSEADYGVAACLEALNKTNEAAAAYQKVATAYAGQAIGEQAKLAQARILEAEKKPEQALRIYNELIPVNPAMRTPASMEAQSHREAIYRDFPNLNTNKPAPRFTVTNAAPGAPALQPQGATAAPGTLTLTPQPSPAAPQTPRTEVKGAAPQKAPAPQQPAPKP
jgi:predicted negative regulator of RcsB-dependent stress response